MDHTESNGHSKSTDPTANGQRSSVAGRQTSIVSSTVGDSFVLLGPNDVLDQYRGHLPRRKGHRRKVAEGCWGLSSTSWMFLLLALLQLLTVSGLQITIAVLGMFYDDRLNDYVQCLEDSLRSHPNISENFTIGNSSMFPQFGQDKAVYIYFFIVLVVYNFILCVYALKQQNIVELYAFMVLNILAMAYACLQVYQFRGFGVKCDQITVVGYLAMANVFVLLIFTVIFGLLSLTIYVEFGWKTYRLLNCNPAMRYYYRVYQVLMSVIKIVILFLVMFCTVQLILLLPPTNNEFVPTIFLAVGVLVLPFPIIYITLTYEWRFGYFGIFVMAFLAIAYCIFKIVRYGAETCPLCIQRAAQVVNDTAQLRMSTGLSNETINDADLRHLFSLDRAEDFANLIMLASLVLIFVLFAIPVMIHHLRFYNKGLKEYFAEQQPNLYLNQHCFKRCYRTRKYDVTDGSEKKGMQLNLTTVQKKTHPNKPSQISTTRDSRLEETMNASEPTFKATGSPQRRPSKPRRDSSLEESGVPEPDFHNAHPSDFDCAFRVL